RQARVALVSTSLIGIDADVVARLVDEEVAVLGVARTDLGPEAATLRRLGVAVVVPVDRLNMLADAVSTALTSGTSSPAPSRLDVDQQSPRGAGDEPGHSPRGKVLAVWGPTGAPGRSVVSLGLASFLAAQGVSTTVIDADVYGGSQAQLLG